jgi:hypothetical protein
VSDWQTRLLISHLDTVLAKQLEGSILAVSVVGMLPFLLFPSDFMLEVFLWHFRVYVL